jgi:hypothetical protein
MFIKINQANNISKRSSSLNYIRSVCRVYVLYSYSFAETEKHCGLYDYSVINCGYMYSISLTINDTEELIRDILE